MLQTNIELNTLVRKHSRKPYSDRRIIIVIKTMAKKAMKLRRKTLKRPAFKYYIKSTIIYLFISAKSWQEK